MDTYIYEGPVLLYGKVISYNWSAETSAQTERKAFSNLVYRFKKDHGYAPRVPISLPGKIRLVRS